MTAQRAMIWWCWAVIVFGLVLVGGAFAATDALATAILAQFGRAPFVWTEPLRFAVGLMAAVTIGWGASLLAVTRATAPLPRETQAALWRGIGRAVAAWFVIDSAISVATGFWPNAVSNAVLAGAFWAIVRKM